jgi:hypothetical protein
MRKIVMPDNEVVAVLIDDYPSFVINKSFPTQSFEQRTHNLRYFIEDIRGCYSDNPEIPFVAVLQHAAQIGAQPVFVAYDDNKDFVGREFLKANNVPIRFIKRPK